MYSIWPLVPGQVDDHVPVGGEGGGRDKRKGVVWMAFVLAWLRDEIPGGEALGAGFVDEDAAGAEGDALPTSSVSVSVATEEVREDVDQKITEKPQHGPMIAGSLALGKATSNSHFEREGICG